MTSLESRRVVDGVVQHPMSDGTTIPQLGFGVAQIDDASAEVAVAEALRVGYRHIDTAAGYDNEGGVGRAIAGSGLARGDVYVTTKVGNDDQGYDSTLHAFDASVRRLGIEQVDLYLIHWALPSRDLYVDTWHALVELQTQGRVRSIGVSNFNPPHLDRIVAETGVTPTINQIELHPYLQQAPLRAADDERGIVTESWSPIGQGQGLLDDPVLADIADGHDATPAQVVIAWHLALDLVVIPKSVTPSRIAENYAARSLTLTADDVDRIAALDRGVRYGGDPDTL